MLIASVVSASASSPASGGGRAKAEGDATGPSGASGSGPRYLNLGSSGSPSARARAGTGTLGGSSSILEVLQEESGTPVVDEASETPQAVPGGSWAARNRLGRAQEEGKGGAGQQDGDPRGQESDDRTMFNNYESTTKRLRFDSVSSYSLVLSKSGGTTGRAGRNSGLNSVAHSQLNKGSRETIPQPQILSFVSQQMPTTSSYQPPRLVMSSKDGGSNMSGHGSILNNFITEGAEEDDAQDEESGSRAVRAAAASLFNSDRKTTSSHRPDNEQIYIDASNEEIAQQTEPVLTSTDEREGRDQNPLITPEGLLCEDGIEQVAARVRKLSDEVGGYRIERTDSLEFTDNSMGDDVAPPEEYTRRHAGPADQDGFAHHAAEAVRASTGMSRADDGQLEAPPEPMSSEEEPPTSEAPGRQLEAEESSFDPALLHVSSAVFEEGAMPRVVRPSQARSPFHPPAPFRHRAQVPAASALEPAASATMTDEDSLEQSKLAASGRIKRHLHDFIRQSTDLGATLGLTPAAGLRPQYRSDVWASKGLTPQKKRPLQPQQRTAAGGSFQNDLVCPVIPETDPRRLERKEALQYAQGWPHQHAAAYQSAGLPPNHGAPEYEIYTDATHGEIQMPNYLYSETDQPRGIPSQYMQSCLNQIPSAYQGQGYSPNGEYTSNDSSPYQTPYKTLTARN